jgi:hypothetical protein
MGASSTRAVYEHFLTQQEAQQLLFIHRALAVNGYRPHVRSLALFDLVLAEPRLLPPLVRCWATNHECAAHGQTSSAIHSSQHARNTIRKQCTPVLCYHQQQLDLSCV